MNREDLIRVWEKFSEKNDFMLNPDKEHVEKIIEGVLANEKKTGFKLCPCRLSDGTREGNLKNICPCNFKADKIWSEKGQCWCGLFVKR